jgi:hypothetical protein
MCVAIYLKQLTNARTKELEQWLSNREEYEYDFYSGTIGEYKVEIE